MGGSNFPYTFGLVNSDAPEKDDEVTNRTLQSTIREPAYDVLILDARLRQSLVSVRSLGSRGLRVAALETSRTTPTFSSRWCQHAFRAPSYEQATDPYLSYLEKLLDRIGTRILITSSDSTIALIRQYRKQLERKVRIALAKEPALKVAINKERTLEIAQELGIGVPKGMKVETVGEVAAALCEIGLPAVVKPVESWVWNEQQGSTLTCKLVTTYDEAIQAVERLTSLGGSTIIQQFLSGRREAVSFLYANGEIYARFAQWAKRTQPPLGGTSVLRQSIAVPSDIGEQAERLVRMLDLEGYCEVEFRRDDAGTPYLMEINPRLSASVEVAVRAGVDFPYLLYQWANGDHIDYVRSYRVGGWMRYLGGDIMTTVEALIQRGRPGVIPPAQAIFDFGASFFVPMGYDYFDWKDPLPACTAIAEFGRALPKRLRTLPKKV
jgi:predicted ATP-grasp superfamily ATP-dependent carboligase